MHNATISSRIAHQNHCAESPSSCRCCLKNGCQARRMSSDLIGRLQLTRHCRPVAFTDPEHEQRDTQIKIVPSSRESDALASSECVESIVSVAGSIALNRGISTQTRLDDDHVPREHSWRPRDAKRSGRWKAIPIGCLREQ